MTIRKEDLKQKYIKEELSLADCAVLFNTSPRRIKKFLVQYKIAVRPKTVSSKGRLAKLQANPNLGCKTGEYYANIKATGIIPENELVRREKITKAMTGRKHTWGDKISESMKGNLNGEGHTVSEETRVSISKKASASIRKKISENGFTWGMKGKKHRPESNLKNRLSCIRYIEKTRLQGMPLKPRLGRNEKEILDNLEKEFGHKIMRQFPIAGYFIDGYIPEIKLAIEIDEFFHYNFGELTDKDKIRQAEIETLLDCKFVRIKN